MFSVTPTSGLGGFLVLSFGVPFDSMLLIWDGLKILIFSDSSPSPNFLVL